MVINSGSWLQIGLSLTCGDNKKNLIILSYLQKQISAIEININNYKKRIETLIELDSTELDFTSGLAFLERFCEFANDKYHTQLKTNYQIFEVGLKPLESFINTIEGIIEIEKTKLVKFIPL